MTTHGPAGNLSSATRDGVPHLEHASLSLTAKRIGAGQALDRWYPYYAGYSQKFAAEVIAELCAAPGRQILDPWNGSGTTTAAAFHAGHAPIGRDLNPSTIVIANAKLIDQAGMDRVPALLDECLASASELLAVAPIDSNDALRAWLPPRPAAFARHAFSWIHGRIEATPLDTSPLSTVALALLRTLRQFAVGARSNSSWSTPDTTLARLRIDAIKRSARAVADELGADRTVLPAEPAPQLCQVGDARALNVPDESIDLVLTSPPYCTRIDYAKHTAFEVAALLNQHGPNARELRGDLMGTTALREKPTQDLNYPPLTRSLLQKIKTHTSHRSAAYYYPNIEQYFRDASRSLAEVYRVLRRGGRAALVLQNSYYKELEIPLSDLFCEIGGSLGMGARVIARRPVGRAMTSVNTRSRKYRSTRSYSEDIVLMEKAL